MLNFNGRFEKFISLRVLPSSGGCSGVLLLALKTGFAGLALASKEQLSEPTVTVETLLCPNENDDDGEYDDEDEMFSDKTFSCNFF